MQDKKGTPDTNTYKTIVDFIMDIPLFDDLSGTDLAIVAKHMNYYELDEGEILFKEGDAGDYVCFVVDGSLDILKQSGSSTHSVAISTVTQKCSIGEMSVIDNTRRSATARARTRTTLLGLPKPGFDLLLDEHPKIGVKILKGIARLMSMNLRKTSSRPADYMLPTI